jgi:processive 1,2-diacylglycerol beta-glucosyltransferase
MADPSAPAKRILVLTSSTGSGHDMRALAFAQWVEIIAQFPLQVRIEKVIENSSALGSFGVWLYNFIHRYCPRAHHIYWFIVELFVRSHGHKLSFGGRYYRKLISTFQPDLVLSVHDSTNRGYFEEARDLLGPKTPLVTYCGEWSGGYGFSHNWYSPAVDVFYARTDEALQYARELGLNDRKGKVFQKLLPPALLHDGIKSEDIGKYRVEQLGLSADRFTLFLATGAFGANHHLAFLKALLPLAAHVQVVVVCGKNRSIYKRLLDWRSTHPQLQLFIEGFSDRMFRLMEVSDAMVTRGGANTTMEALHIGCPIIYNGLGSLMPQETLTVRYLEQHGAAVRIHSAKALASVVEKWMERGAEWQQVKAALNKLYRDEDPREFVSEVLALIPR